MRGGKLKFELLLVVLAALMLTGAVTSAATGRSTDAPGVALDSEGPAGMVPDVSVITQQDPTGAAGTEVMTMAPVSPEFIAWQKKVETFGLEMYDEEGHALGHIPSPFDWSHLLFQKAEVSEHVGAPASYDLRSYGHVTPVKNQGACGACWSFATYGSLESWLLKNPGENWDFSENHMKNYHGFNWGPCVGGNADISTAYLVRWSGPVDESDDPYNPWDDRPSPGGPLKKQMKTALWFYSDSDIKDELMTRGAMYISFYWDPPYYNSTDYTYYYSGAMGSNHAVTLIGWDDNKVVVGAPGNGAWLLKNSWGVGWGNAGYFWISYFDSHPKYAVAYCDAVPPSSYSTNYQYDPLGRIGGYGYPPSTTAWGANVFIPTADEPLVAVGFYALANNTAYEIYVYDNFDGSTFSVLLGSVSGTAIQYGYHTITLPSPINLTNGDDFSIVIKFTTPGYNFPVPSEWAIAGYSSAATAGAGESYISSTGTSGTWFDHGAGNQANCCIKGLTSEKEDVKWEQLPDETEYGIDIRCDRSDGIARTLADDFECTTTGPITKVIFWGSWYRDIKGKISKIHLSIHNNDPCGPSGYSEPNELLWEKDFTDFNETLYHVGYEPEWFWDPAIHMPPIQWADFMIWQYEIDLCPEQVFIQQGDPCDPNIYWLDIYVELEPDTNDPCFGWKTSYKHWEDDAVYDDGTFIWNELRYPWPHPYYQHNESIDLAFAIYTGEPCEPEPNENIKWSQPPVLWEEPDIYIGWDEESHDWLPRMVLDDFLCDTDRPITAIRWWGSLLGWYEDIVPDGELPDGFYITIWSDVPDPDPCDPCTYSHPKEIIWDNYCPTYDVEFYGWEADPHYGQGTLYFSEDWNGNGLYTLDTSTGQATNMGISGVTTATVGLAPSPSITLLYGSDPWDIVHINTDGSGSVSVGGGIGYEGMAYDPTSGTLYAAINGAFFTVNPATGAKITDLTAPGADVEGLAFGNGFIYGLVSLGIGGTPGHLLKYDITAGSWSFVGNTLLGNVDDAGLAYNPFTDTLYAKGSQSSNLYSIDPHTAATNMIGDTGIIDGGGLAFVISEITGDYLPKFEFYQELDPCDYWYQPNDVNVYWLGITAIYGDMPHDPYYPWGWETRPHFFQDDAVRFFGWPEPDQVYPADYFEPIKLHEETWDLSFELISRPKKPSKPLIEHSKWSQPPIEIDPSSEIPVYSGWNQPSYFGPTGTACLVIEDFEDGDIAEYTVLGGTHNVTGAAAHDGQYGLESEGWNVTWIYRTDADVQVSQGDTISYWVKVRTNGRAYCGFGASATGTYSIVAAMNSNAFLIQLNLAYGYLDIGSSPQTWTLDKWYRLEVEWDVGGNITGKLYDSDGTTLLNTVTATDNTYTSGGIAFRAFDENVMGVPDYFDTVERCSFVSSAARELMASRLPTSADVVMPNPADAIGWDEDNNAFIFPKTETSKSAAVKSLEVAEALPIEALDDRGISQTAISGTTQVYQNYDANSVNSYYSPGQGVLMADDIDLAGTDRTLVEYDFTVYAPAGTAPYTVTSELYTDNTGYPGTAIAGTYCLHNVTVDGAVVLNCAGSGAILPDNVWMVLEFSDAEAGWVIGEKAEIGFTADVFAQNDPPWTLYWFGGDPDAGFEANIWCEPEVTTVGNLVADDFRCLGTMPITSIHWWGSHIGWERSGVTPPELPVAWQIGFWSNVPADPYADPNYSYPQELLWQFEVNANRVDVNEVGTDYYHGYYPNDICYQYTLYMEPEEYFWQADFNDVTEDNIFWLSILAIYPDDIELKFPWGWKTRPWHWMDDAVTFELDEIPLPGMVLDPHAVTPIKDPIYQESFDVAFELNTDPCWIKWEQHYTGIRHWPHYEDELSMEDDLVIKRLVADDWKCELVTPVTAAAWWGSYLDYQYKPCHGEFMPLPVQPDYFLLSIWTDVPDPDPCDLGTFSHPGEKIWEYKAYDYDEVLVGYDKHPHDGDGGCVVVPNANATVEGNTNNGYPFNIAVHLLTSQRYQQIYDEAEVGQSGTITQVRFRPDDTVGGPFGPSNMNVDIYLGYSANPVSSPSATFANNIGAGYTLVYSGTLTLSSAGTGGPPRNFDIVVDVDDNFTYDPTVGPLLLDVYMYTASVTTQFDAANDSSISRIFTSSGGTVNDPSGSVNTYNGLVTMFCFDGATPSMSAASSATDVSAADRGPYEPDGISGAMRRVGGLTDAQIREQAMSASVNVPTGPQKTNLGTEGPVIFTGHVLTTDAPSGPCANILYAPTQSDSAAFRAALSAACGGCTVDYYDARVGTPSVALLSTYDCVFTWVDFAYADKVAFGDNLADYVDAGGKVVLGQWCYQSDQTNWLEGRIMTSAYCPVTVSTGYSSGSYAGDGTDCVHNGVTAYDTTYLDDATLQPGCQSDGTFTPNGEISVAWRPDRRVYYSSGNTGTWYGTGDWDILTCNMCRCEDEAVTAGREPVFRYSVRIPEAEWFLQEEVNDIYWFSVVAVYEDSKPNYDWGWTNHKHVFNDDAVTGYPDPAGLDWTWKPLYDQTGETEDMSFILYTDPDWKPEPEDCLIGGNAGPLEYPDWVAWGKPDCWCYPRQCRGDIDGKQLGPFWVSLNDLVLFRLSIGKLDALLPDVCSDLDHKKLGPFRVSLNDLVIIRQYIGKMAFQIPVCDQPPIYTGPYNFWTSP